MPLGGTKDEHFSCFHSSGQWGLRAGVPRVPSLDFISDFAWQIAKYDIFITFCLILWWFIKDGKSSLQVIFYDIGVNPVTIWFRERYTSSISLKMSNAKKENKYLLIMPIASSDFFQPKHTNHFLCISLCN